MTATVTAALTALGALLAMQPSTVAVPPPAPIAPVPHARQLAWHDL